MTDTDRLYEVTLIGQYAGQEIVNRWNYLGHGADTVTNASLGLAEELGALETGSSFASGSLFDNLTTFTVTDMVWHECLIRSIYEPTDFADIPFPTPKAGQVSAQGEPPFVAIGFRSNRIRSDIGRGYKRFAGIGEGSVDALGIVNATLLTNLATTAGLLSAELDHDFSGSSWSFKPVVVHKHKTTEDDPPAGRYIYFVDKTDQLDNLAVGIVYEPYSQVRSQTSRQYGKGR